MGGHWTGLDAGNVVTPVDIEQALLRLLAQIDKGVAALEESENTYSEASYEHDIAYARALVRSQASSAEKRKAEAVIAVDDLLHAKVRAEAVKTTRKERMKALLEQVEIVRSIGASVRVTYGNANVGQP